MKRLPLILGVVVIALVGLAFFAAKGPSDRELIRQALDESIVASREGRAGSVLDLISRDLRVNEMQIGGNRLDLAKYIRESRPDVTIATPEPTIAGETATIVSDIGIKGEVPFVRTPVQGRLDDVKIILRRETARKWLVIPTRVWRITDVEAEQIDPSQFFSGVL